jgi:transcriptional regulator with XRE-family HTH domain
LPTTSELWNKLNDTEYRKAFVASQINIGIPFQIRALMKTRGWTQEKLADKTGMRQPSISGLMTPGKTSPNIKTLQRLAEAFDCGLAVRFVPFSELAEWSDKFDPETFYVPEFGNDSEHQEKEVATQPAYFLATTINEHFLKEARIGAVGLEALWGGFEIVIPNWFTPHRDVDLISKANLNRALEGSRLESELLVNRELNEIPLERQTVHTGDVRASGFIVIEGGKGRKRRAGKRKQEAA